MACITEQVLSLVNKRIGLYRHFDETINRYKQSRDVSTLNSGRKSLETEHKALTSEIAQLQSRLKTEGSDLCDKVGFCASTVTCLPAGLPYELHSATHSATWWLRLGGHACSRAGSWAGCALPMTLALK